MFIQKNQPYDLIIILLQKNKLLCAALSKSNHKPYILKHLTTTYASCFATTNSLIQTTAIGKDIATFIRKYKLEKSFISLVCDDPIIQEGFATTITASAQQYLQNNLTIPHAVLHTLYLGPYQDAFLHWWTRINYPLILQIQLMTRTHKLNIIRTLSPFPLILETYKKIRGTIFHPVQLITDLERSNFELVSILDNSILKNFLYYDTYTEIIDQKTVATLIGAALYEGY